MRIDVARSLPNAKLALDSQKERAYWDVHGAESFIVLATAPAERVA